MSKKHDDSGEVREPHATYRIPRRVKNRKAIERAIRIQDEIRKRHASNPGDGRDSVAIIREWRDRGCAAVARGHGRLRSEES